MSHDLGAGQEQATGHGAGHDGGDGHGRVFSSECWDGRYKEGGDGLVAGPSSYVTEDLADLTPGSCLEAGCGTGADAIWLASHGWDVTGVDVSPAAIERARSFLERETVDMRGSLEWVVADLMSWKPPQRYDLVVSQYVHPDGPFTAFVERLAGAVGAEGTLFVVGHDHADSHVAEHMRHHDVSMGTAAVTDALDLKQWTMVVAETRHRQMQRRGEAVSLVDTVVRAQRIRG